MSAADLVHVGGPTREVLFDLAQRLRRAFG